MQREYRSEFDGMVSIAPQTIKGAVTGTGVDLKGYRGATVNFVAGTIGDGNSDDIAVCKVQESSDDSSYTDVAAADLRLGSGGTLNLATNEVKRVGYVGSLRYIRAVMTPISGADCPGAATVLRHAPDHSPV